MYTSNSRRTASALERTAGSALCLTFSWILSAAGCGFERDPLKVADEDALGGADQAAGGGANGAGAGGGGNDSALTGGTGASNAGSGGSGAAGNAADSGVGGGLGDDEPAADDPADDEPGEDLATDAGADHEPESVSGLSCGGTACPPVPLGNEQCCTSNDDVSDERALQDGRCGVELPSKGGCFELEQPGVLDDRCPELAASGARPAEVGCCTPEGACGTVNGAEGIGCHVDQSDEKSCGGPVDDETHCDTTGWFAMRARIDVTWGGRSGALFDLTDDGRGTIVVDLLAKIPEVDDDGAFESELRACAATLPPFVSSTLCEHYQPIFPTRIWDSDTAPTFPVAGQYSCDNPGCSLAFEGWNGVVGIELEDPDGEWPSATEATSFSCPSGDGLDCYPDHDDDGQPGIRVELLTSGTSPGSGSCSQFRTRAAPLSANPLAVFDGVRRTDRIDLGVRLRMGATGRLAEDCSGAEGIGLAEFVQSRAARCLVQRGTNNAFQLPAGENTACTSTELTFVNRSLPDYDALALGESPSSALELADDEPSEGPRYRIVRLHGLGESASCADARAALDVP